jgi:hypothetical protein
MMVHLSDLLNTPLNNIKQLQPFVYGQMADFNRDVDNLGGQYHLWKKSKGKGKARESRRKETDTENEEETR